MNKEEIINKIIDYFTENEDVFDSVLEDLDGWCGFLDNDRYYYMNEIDEFYSDVPPSELLSRAFYGYDADSYNTLADGRKEYAPFNPNREFFYYNGYGNFVSTDRKDYSDYLDSYVIEKMVEHRQNMQSMFIEDTPELAELFDELEKLKKEN